MLSASSGSFKARYCSAFASAASRSRAPSRFNWYVPRLIVPLRFMLARFARLPSTTAAGRAASPPSASPARARILRSSQRTGSYRSSATRSFSGMIALSVSWIPSGQTSVQHLVMLHSPTPNSSLMSGLRSSVSSGCMSRVAMWMRKRGPAKLDFLWSRTTWQTSWQRKHSMHFRNSWMRSMSRCCIRHVPSASRGRGFKGGIFFATSKFQLTSVTRSLMIGKDFIGVTVIGSPSGK